MTPKNLKQLLLILQETIKCHEDIFGKIVLERAFEPNLANIHQSFEMLRKTIESITAGTKSQSSDQSDKPSGKRKK
jgi:hypothetical protein